MLIDLSPPWSVESEAVRFPPLDRIPRMGLSYYRGFQIISGPRHEGVEYRVVLAEQRGLAGESVASAIRLSRHLSIQARISSCLAGTG